MNQIDTQTKQEKKRIGYKREEKGEAYSVPYLVSLSAKSNVYNTT